MYNLWTSLWTKMISHADCQDLAIASSTHVMLNNRNAQKTFYSTPMPTSAFEVNSFSDFHHVQGKRVAAGLACRAISLVARS